MRIPRFTLRLLFALFCGITLVSSSLPTVHGEAPLRDLDSHCPFTPPTDLATWQKRAADVKLQLEVALGLFPQAELDPVKPKIYGKIEKDDYTIEKVTFESLPGFFVTGNLYRPKNAEAGKQMPGVLCPHGHWSNARFYDENPAAVKQLLASGAERFENAARNHIQARCVQLARMGCVVFHWDMIGYCDSLQISFDRAHRFGKQPAESEIKEDGWLLFSPLAEGHCQSILGLQSLATQRAVDMLLTLDDVDPKRIAITGASGGGTQSFLGAAVDTRISLAFPAVMVSTGMQGGCTCENASLLRTGTGNVEMAGLIAPRPMGLTAADDWTRTMPKDGFPELQKLYELFGAKNKVALFPAVHFGHNYNHVSRVAMYGMVSEHFGLGFPKPVLERDFELAEGKDLSVWDADHPQPAGGEEFERRLMKAWAANVDSVMRGMLRGDSQQQKQLKSVLHSGWKVCLGLTAFPLHAAKGEKGEAEQVWNLESSRDSVGLRPKTDTTQLSIAVATPGSPEKLSSTWEIVYSEDANASPEQPLVSNPRLAAAYTYGYNLPLFAQRARQTGVAIAWLKSQNPDAAITLTASGADAALAAAGLFVAEQLHGGELANVTANLDVGGFRFADVKSIRDTNFLPGAARFWDLPGLVACLRTSVNVTDASQPQFDDLKKLAKE
jgi:hypothetical protein